VGILGFGGLRYASHLREQWALFEIVKLGGLATSTSVSFQLTPVTNAGLEHLKGLTKLQKLDLDRAQITDAGLKHLKGLTKLQELHLNNTQVTDAGLVHLKAVKPSTRHAATMETARRVISRS
jgi:hypothetical protein